MFNTINPYIMELPKTNNPNTHSKTHKRLVSYTGYASMGFGVLCGLSGLKSVKLKNKMKIHKTNACLTAIFTALHFSFVKGLDKLFCKQNS